MLDIARLEALEKQNYFPDNFDQKIFKLMSELKSGSEYILTVDRSSSKVIWPGSIDCFFYVATGAVALKLTDSEGERSSLGGILTKGSWVHLSDASLIADASYEVRPLTESSLFSFSKHTKKEMYANDQIKGAIFQDRVDQLRSMEKLLNISRCNDGDTRLLRLLVYFGEALNMQDEQEMVFNISGSDLAAYVGLNPQTLSRARTRLAAKDIIIKGEKNERRKLVTVDYTLLKAVAYSPNR